MQFYFKLKLNNYTLKPFQIFSFLADTMNQNQNVQIDLKEFSAIAQECYITRMPHLSVEFINYVVFQTFYKNQ